MLAHILAIAVGLGSVTLYLAAFFFPEVHRKHDFFWSGVGCFYALVLWVDAGQISLTELLGHGASTALVVWFGWQTLSLRRKRTPRDLQTPLNDQSWQAFGREITSLGVAWLRHTPLGRFIPGTSLGTSNRPLGEGEFRASSLKQVDYEFLDELPPNQGLNPRGKAPQSDSVPVPIRTAKQSDRQLGTRPTPSTRSSGSGKSQPWPQSAQKPLSLVEKGIVLKDWLIELVTSAAKPKPQKPVLVIPPRESRNLGPSIRNPAPNPAEVQKSAEQLTAVDPGEETRPIDQASSQLSSVLPVEDESGAPVKADLEAEGSLREEGVSNHLDSAESLNGDEILDP